MDTAVDVEGIEELQEIKQFHKERKSLEIPDKYFNDDTHRVVWAANKSGVKFTIDGWHTHLCMFVMLHIGRNFMKLSLHLIAKNVSKFCTSIVIFLHCDSLD